MTNSCGIELVPGQTITDATELELLQGAFAHGQAFFLTVFADVRLLTS